MKKFKVISLIATVVIGLVIVLLSVIQVSEPEMPPLVSLAGFQDADAPLVTPAGQAYDPALARLSAYDRALLAPAVDWSAPLGSATGGLAVERRGFLAYAPDGKHLGVDLEGIGGADSTLGEPVYAVANGLIVFSGSIDPEWGKVVVIAHRDPSGKLRQSIYAHLDEIRMTRGLPVMRGQVIGTVGDGSGERAPQLHFALRDGDAVAPGAHFADEAAGYLSPAEVLAKLDSIPHPEVLELVRAAERAEDYPSGAIKDDRPAGEAPQGEEAQEKEKAPEN
jgi:murein DD-endopeptidase MepM/ murein hydrolase activator NlpD